MKKLITITLVLFCFLLITNRAAAQDYKMAIGLKFGGYENGISGKYFLNQTSALEAIIGLRSHGAALTGLYEFHLQAFNVPGLNFYYGAGGHLGGVGNRVDKSFGNDNYYRSKVLIGADGVLGLEYKIDRAPIAISLDLNPRIEFATGPFFDLAPGLGLKYTF
ncbi:hypothetical protein [Mucilaginibacter glaciei]|uniref:DUF3575 domain-containing protein n=1 Tax=Mucilaginibacter glaciei TaxID=2772109 RepID=A0A926NWM5_9SPHI|nr:hypothetical protein [Mucilaginibacter glaciei]MBD1393064.1 hypothetical protein [Mucilaginibacter glaciei]